MLTHLRGRVAKGIHNLENAVVGHVGETSKVTGVYVYFVLADRHGVIPAADLVGGSSTLKGADGRTVLLIVGRPVIAPALSRVKQRVPRTSSNGRSSEQKEK